MPIPLNKPHKKPTAGATNITTYQGIPAFEAIAKPIRDNIIIDPTDKSIPAVTMTINTPRASMDCQDTCLKTFVIFLQDRKTSGCKICSTVTIISIKSRIPYFSKKGISFTKVLS